jgi:DNA repair protein RadC
MASLPPGIYALVRFPTTLRGFCEFAMPITDWPADERPREKLLQRGPEALSDAELLAIFLRTGIRGKTAVDLARDLLQEFGSLRALLECDLARFSRSAGLGSAKYALLQAVLEMARRHLREKVRRENALTSPELTRDFLTFHLRGYGHEVFGCLFLDNQHRVIGFEELFRGTIDGASVYPREVVKKALAWNAAAVIFAHNRYSRPKVLPALGLARWARAVYSQIYSLWVMVPADSSSVNSALSTVSGSKSGRGRWAPAAAQEGRPGRSRAGLALGGRPRGPAEPPGAPGDVLGEPARGSAGGGAG